MPTTRDMQAGAAWFRRTLMANPATRHVNAQVNQMHSRHARGRDLLDRLRHIDGGCLDPADGERSTDGGC